MKTDILNSLELFEDLSMTIRLSQHSTLSNLYFSDAAKLTFQHIPLISKEHDDLIGAIELLTLADKQHVNHLFVQFFCMAHDPSGNLKCLHSTLCFDQEQNNLYLACSSPSLFQDHYLINFASRDKQDFSEIQNIKFYYLSAEDFPDLEIAHSEHLLLKYLKKNRYLILDFLTGHGIEPSWEIKKIGINLYSSLDCCDRCQNTLLNFFELESPFTKQLNADLSYAGHQLQNKLAWQIIFFSNVPCKKSSYIATKNNSYTPFRYDKEKKIFVSTKEPQQQLSFPCQINALEIKQLSQLLMLSQIKDL